MENQQSFWQFSDQIRLQSTVNDEFPSKWGFGSSYLSNFSGLSINENIKASNKPEPRRNQETRGKPKQKNADFNSYNDGWKLGGGGYGGKNGSSMNLNKPSENTKVKNYNNNNSGKNNKDRDNNNNKGPSNGNATDKRFKTLPPSESLPRNEKLGGYIFVCNNDTMQDDLRRQLFGLPQRYRDSVRAITPGLPLFLYNYSTHQLHGIFEAASFGGTNIDPTAWEDKKCPGESRFPAQVRVVTRMSCKPLEEDSFRPILHHYDGPKFRLQLNIPEALALLDIFAESNL
ncbi:B2 protein [Amborella trichopoda]|uniref:DCD domain-containing protein n=1 Tax=Amborella trichopoda TaxID=13333 RepID=W1Q0R6_AMBTC|nr:B2 protein [Amborella trichopoda]ERN14076.1 hypothetical protein AMTR_s00021p00224090 [Amborella trichopoda]|eukprot:XP_006852609.1 B2 protein [Amborella trichopoda]